MTTDTQKTWTLHLDGTDATEIPHEQMIDLFWKAMHGYGTLEQLVAKADDGHERPLAA
ncbi:hypothetical protein [Baekduia soli]|uniref:hypothetical protein n=1 Tax=Baekduia soli TaxID=496014 RepID=UPI00165269B6|nr:hypothetical protein [Baekduia soli]